ncbi:MAG: PmoA family protein [Planctomycetes bacterium]|nr:PmoA family protein [Planctomycetota bacterium]
MSRIRWFGLALAIAGFPFAPLAAADWSFRDTAGSHLDILCGGKLVGRYMYAHDNSTPEKRLETYKPYLHVFDPEGRAPITKGVGGLYTHHRAVFIGWSKIGFNGKSYDRWHMNNGEQVHRKFLPHRADSDGATLRSIVHWNDEAGKPIIVEERTMRFSNPQAPWYAVLDFASTLEAPNGDVKLDGDPEHAGMQFRPADEVVRADATYVFPKEGADPRKDRDYPWVGETFTLTGERYSVVHMNHPGNPKDTIYSAYRDYGRFGAFFRKDIPKGGSLTVRYRILVATGEMPGAAVIQKCWDAFAEAKPPSPVPEITVKGGVKKK